MQTPVIFIQCICQPHQGQQSIDTWNTETDLHGKWRGYSVRFSFQEREHLCCRPLHFRRIHLWTLPLILEHPRNGMHWFSFAVLDFESTDLEKVTWGFQTITVEHFNHPGSHFGLQGHRKKWLELVNASARHSLYPMTSVKTSGEMGCWDKSKNPYPLGNYVIPTRQLPGPQEPLSLWPHGSWTITFACWELLYFSMGMGCCHNTHIGIQWIHLALHGEWISTVREKWAGNL